MKLPLIARSQTCEKRLLASVCRSVRPRGTTPHPWEGFSQNSIFEFFPKSVKEVQMSVISYKNNDTLREDLRTFMTMPR